MKHKEEIERRMHPKKGKDFEVLYNELEAWRLNETRKIKASAELKEEEKKLAIMIKKQEKVLFVAFHLLLNLAEDLQIERKMRNR